MKKHLIFWVLLFALVTTSQAQFGHVPVAMFKVVDDTSVINKSVGRAYHFTTDHLYYVGAGTYLKQVATEGDSISLSTISVDTLYGRSTDSIFVKDDLIMLRDILFSGTSSNLSYWVDSGGDTVLVVNPNASGGPSVYMMDGTEADTVRFYHNGTDFILWTDAGTGKVDFEDTFEADSIRSEDGNFVFSPTTDKTTMLMAVVNDSLSIGKATATDNVVPYFRIKGDADSDASAVTSETMAIRLTGAATPTNSKWTVTSTQGLGYSFDNHIYMVSGKEIGLTPTSLSSIRFNDGGFAGGSLNLNTANTIGAGNGTSGILFANTTLVSKSSGTASLYALNIPYTINLDAAVSSGTMYGIYTNATETNLRGLSHYLMDLQVGSVTQFRVTNAGTGYFAGNLGIGTTAPLTSSLTLGNKATKIDFLLGRENTAAGTDSSIYGRISSGVPYWRLNAADGDTLSLWHDGSSGYIAGHTGLGLKVGNTTELTLGSTTTTSYNNFDPSTADNFTLGASAAWKQASITDYITLGGKGQTAEFYISTENTFTGSDSSLFGTVTAGVPVWRFNGSDGDQYQWSINTSDEAILQNAAGLTLDTGTALKLGTLQWDVIGTDSINGAKIAAGTIAATSLVLAKDLVSGTGLDGGVDNILPGTDTDVTLNVLVDYDGGVEVVDDSLNIKLNGATLTLGTAGLSVTNDPALRLLKTDFGDSLANYDGFGVIVTDNDDFEVDTTQIATAYDLTSGLAGKLNLTAFGDSLNNYEGFGIDIADNDSIDVDSTAIATTYDLTSGLAGKLDKTAFGDSLVNYDGYGLTVTDNASIDVDTAAVATQYDLTHITSATATWDSLITRAEVSKLDSGAVYTFATGVAGWGEMLAGDNVEWAHFRFTSAGLVTLIANSANVDTVSVGGGTALKVDIYDAGTGIAIRNNLAKPAKKVAIKVNYYTP